MKHKCGQAQMKGVPKMAPSNKGSSLGRRKWARPEIRLALRNYRPSVIGALRTSTAVCTWRLGGRLCISCSFFFPALGGASGAGKLDVASHSDAHLSTGPGDGAAVGSL